MVVPLGYLLLRSTEASDPLALLTSDRVLRFLSTTLRLAGVVTVVSVALGGTLAWLLERTDLPGRRVLAVVAVLPLVVPTYVLALALVSAVGPGGLVASWSWVRGFWGATVALVAATMPTVVLLGRAELAGTDGSFDDAARALGDSALTRWRRLVIPQLRPALGAGGLLCFLYVLSDFGAVSILGVDTLNRGIYFEYRSLSSDRSSAAVLGVLLVALSIAVIAVERAVRRRGAAQAIPSAPVPYPVTHLGRWRWPAAAAVALVGLAAAGGPVAVLIVWAYRGTSGPDAIAELIDAGRTSLSWSAAAALLAVAAALPVAILAVRFRSRAARVIETAAVAGFALPGLVVALALVFMTLRVAPVVYQTGLVVVAAYVVRFLPEALGAVRPAVAAVDPAVEDAARALGRGRAAVLATVTLPLVRGGALAGGSLVFLTAMKELPATLLLQPPGSDTLAVRVWTAASEGFYARAALPALALVVLSAALLAPLRFGGPRR
ncbi:MAG TPA: iron ABC transporter permease [Acidimicrobiales bacterium]|nr:iron ABC transporter permease [Acidimicrobiales bacterium]